MEWGSVFGRDGWWRRRWKGIITSSTHPQTLPTIASRRKHVPEWYFQEDFIRKLI